MSPSGACNWRALAKSSWSPTTPLTTRRSQQRLPVLCGPLTQRGGRPPGHERPVIPHGADIAHASVAHLPHELDSALGILFFHRPAFCDDLRQNVRGLHLAAYLGAEHVAEDIRHLRPRENF